MNDLYRALGDISSIRRQMANTTEFRGYGPATLATTGIFAILAATAQARWVPTPGTHANAYLTVWISTAVVSAILTGVQMYTRTRRMHSGLSNAMLRMAVEQFVPSVVTGLLITVVLVNYVPTATWMLPGLWQIVFALGIFSSLRFLPRMMFLAGAWYLLTGLTCMAIGGTQALSPWTMGLAFGAGQSLVAAILWLRATEVDDEA